MESKLHYIPFFILLSETITMKRVISRKSRLMEHQLAAHNSKLAKKYNQSRLVYLLDPEMTNLVM